MMKRLLLSLLFITSCTVSTKIIPTPLPTPPPDNPPVIVKNTTHNLTYFGYWLDSGKAPNTNLITITWWTNEEEKINAKRIFELARSTNRKVILWTPFFSYGPTERSTGGYYLDQSSINRWNENVPFISSYLDTIFAFYLADEPADVAWGDKGNESYNPNLYNYIVEYASNVIKATFPNAKVALNYGNVPGDLVVPKGLDWLGLECYYGDYKPKLAVLEKKTSLPLMLMGQAFDDGNYGDAGDKILAQFANELYSYAKTDEQVFGLFPFLYCIEASSNCDDINFSTIGGVNLPLTREAYNLIGKDIVK